MDFIVILKKIYCQAHEFYNICFHSEFLFPKDISSVRTTLKTQKFEKFMYTYTKIQQVVKVMDSEVKKEEVQTSHTGNLALRAPKEKRSHCFFFFLLSNCIMP
jgi:hypothetical protein